MRATKTQQGGIGLFFFLLTSLHVETPASQGCLTDSFTSIAIMSPLHTLRLPIPAPSPSDLEHARPHHELRSYIGPFTATSGHA